MGLKTNTVYPLSCGPIVTGINDRSEGLGNGVRVCIPFVAYGQDLLHDLKCLLAKKYIDVSTFHNKCLKTQLD